VPRKNFFKKRWEVEPRVSTTHAPLGTTRGAGAPGGGRAGDSLARGARAGGRECAGGRADHSRHLIPDPLSQPQPNPLPVPMAAPTTTPPGTDNPALPRQGSRRSPRRSPRLVFPYLSLPCESPRCQKFDTPICLIPKDFGQKVPSTKK